MQKIRMNNEAQVSAIGFMTMALAAINPSAIDAKNNIVQNPKTNTIEVVEKDLEREVPTYILRPEIQQSQKTNNPYGWGVFDKQVIKYSRPALNGKYVMVYTSYPGREANVVNKVYVFDPTAEHPPSMDSFHRPGSVHRLIFHDLGPDKEFLGLVIDVCRVENGKIRVTGTEELVVNEEEGQDLINMLQGDTKWDNQTGLNLIITKSENIQKPNLRFYYGNK